MKKGLFLLLAIITLGTIKVSADVAPPMITDRYIKVEVREGYSLEEVKENIEKITGVYKSSINNADEKCEVCKPCEECKTSSSESLSDSDIKNLKTTTYIIYFTLAVLLILMIIVIALLIGKRKKDSKKDA